MHADRPLGTTLENTRELFVASDQASGTDTFFAPQSADNKKTFAAKKAVCPPATTD